MKEPIIPDNEEARLIALKSYNVLDTLPEQTFEDITLLASIICNTPIALISLIDDSRQWFKSRRGLDVTHTDKEISFCGHALNEYDKLLIVPDATKDERFHDNPLVTGKPKIKFYAGAVLCSPTGEALGTVCVIDRRARRLNEDQIESLEALARLTMSMLELRRAEIQVEKYRKKRKQELIDEVKKIHS